MDSTHPDEWICRAHCSFFKPERTEEERCRGYTLACLMDRQSIQDEARDALPPFDPDFRKAELRSTICHVCPFLIDGCDFTSPEPPHDCLPCGGLVLLSRLLKKEAISLEYVEQTDLLERSNDKYLGLSPQCALKRLEEDYLYHIGTDELYEVNQEAASMLERCDGSVKTGEFKPDPEFLRFCVEEDLLRLDAAPSSDDLWPGRSPTPSLRYLEWLVTFRCNLSCAHCYLGDARSEEFPRELIRPLLEQFSRMQGLRILVSGGEPAIYEHFATLNDALPDYPVRAVLLSNGVALTDSFIERLNFYEVQISLDGAEKGHETLRGKGSFARAIKAMEAIRSHGLDLSVATMIHRGNLDEWDEIDKIVRSVGAREWSIDYPCVKGRWESHPELAVDLGEAAKRMAYGYGGSYHGSSPGWTCGRHLAAALPSGELCKCGLLADTTYGSISEGLEAAWKRVPQIPIDRTDCKACEAAEECGGGCRYRAGGESCKDEVMCRVYGV